MTYTQTIPVGRSFTMVEDVEYALPSGNWAWTTSGSGTFEYSDDKSTWTAVGTTNPLAATWVRSHSDDLSVRIEHY